MEGEEALDEKVGGVRLELDVRAHGERRRRHRARVAVLQAELPHHSRSKGLQAVRLSRPADDHRAIALGVTQNGAHLQNVGSHVLDGRHGFKRKGAESKPLLDCQARHMQKIQTNGDTAKSSSRTLS